MNFTRYMLINILNSVIWFLFSFRLSSNYSWIFWIFTAFFFITNTIYFWNKNDDEVFQQTDTSLYMTFNNGVMTLVFFMFMTEIELIYKFLAIALFLFIALIATNSRNGDRKDVFELKNLLDSKIQELGELHNISSAINSILDLERLLDMVLSVTVDVLKVGRVSLFLFDEDKKNLILKISKGLKKELINNLKIKIGEGIIGKVAETGKPLLIKNIEKEMPELIEKSKHNENQDENKKEHYKTNSFLCVPLKIKNETIGVLSVNDKNNNEIFNENDLELLTILSSQIAVAIENANLYDTMKDSYKSTIKALSNALDAKDSYTGGHSSQVTKYALPIALDLGFDKHFIERLEYAGMLHDIGKIGIIETILNKNGRLTEDEFDVIKKHPVIGADILSSVSFLEDIVPIVRYHHERWDGNGYPEGLKGEDIPVGARIIAVADTFDAMTSDRPYRKGLPAEIARAEIERCSGSQFDPAVVKSFLKLFDEGKIVVEKYESKNRWF
ncbi:MAG: HD-GYP domain-containing protein [Candidatus Muiribacteriota bacterium]